MAWVSLDEDDNDPARFWAYVVGALRTAGVEVPAALRGRRRRSGHLAPATPALPLLINALATAGRPHVLVLDDYHLISDAAVHDGVRFLLDHLPRASHLVIATRTEPPVGISRLRARARARRDRQRAAALQRRRGRGAAQRHARPRAGAG